MNTPTTCMRWLGIPLLLAMAFFSIVLHPTTARAQDERATGSLYVLAFPDTVTNTFDPRFPNTLADKYFIYIWSGVDNNKITVRGQGYNRVLTASAGKFLALELTDRAFRAPRPVVTEIGQVSSATFRVESQYPIVIYCYFITTFGSEAWTPIPVEFWGTDYYAASRPGEVGSDVQPGGEFNYRSTP